MRPTVRGIAILVLALLAFVASLPAEGMALRMISALLIAVVAVDLLFAPRGLEALRLRVGPRATIAGRRFVEDVLVELDPTRPPPRVSVTITEPASRSAGSAVVLDIDERGARARALLDARIKERGHWTERRFSVEALSVFGTIVTRRDVVVPGDVVIEPARLAIDDALVRSFESLWMDEIRLTTQRRGTEFWTLRELEPLGDLRHVHALRSATAQRLLARDMRGTEATNIELVLDLRAGNDTMTQHARFELALRFAASCADRADRPELDLAATIIGHGRLDRYDLEDAQARSLFLHALADASPMPVVPLDEAVLAHFERKWRARFVLIEAGVEDRELVRRIGDPLRPLHVRASKPRGHVRSIVDP
ncbi:MAG: DUF58 domain-containing protein [Planctomycetes bacterium]|nr:DUF58 domain-containing protein [Planctomycetota bacterium]MCB9918046.1 DUF58 domain-containing protein [Planctomycetota bacterium]